MSAAPSACASALSLEMMSATAQQTAVRRICQTRGCHVSFRENGHRHCCAECKRTFGARHSGRCRDVQRRDRASVHEAPAAVANRFFPCCTSGCARVTTGTYLYCCSYCADSGGTLHSVRCQNRRGVTYPAGTTGATGATGATVPPATTATSVAGTGALVVPTAWNTAWPAPIAMTDAGEAADRGDDGDDGDGRATLDEAGDRVSARASRWSSRHPLPNPVSAMASEHRGTSEASEVSSVQPVKPVQDLQPVIDLEVPCGHTLSEVRALLCAFSNICCPVEPLNNGANPIRRA